MRNLIILLLTIVMIGCDKKTNTDLPEFSFNDSSYLRIHIMNCKTPVSINLIYNIIIPYKQVKMNVYFEKDTTEVIRLVINHPVAVAILAKDSYATCYVFPKDTLDIWADLSQTKNFANDIVFKGKTASISNYLNKAKINTSSVPYITESVSEYNIRVDSIINLGLTALYNFNQGELLPAWFLKMEEADIHYSGISDKVSQFINRYLFYNKYVSRPNDFIKTLGAQIDNPSAKYCGSYYEFLCNLSTNKFDTLLAPQYVNSNIFYDFIKENIKTAEKYLNSEIKDIFIAQRIGSILSVKGIGNAISTNNNQYFIKVDSLINYAKTNLRDTMLLDVLLTYQRDQYQAAKESQSLQPGTSASDFMLTDLSGKTLSLSDFKGQLVFINFWATWCSPCIKSIPEKNKLYNTYNRKGVVFCNICLDYEEQKWRSLIYENAFQGIHLICKGNWSNILDKSYLILAIPHYTLIDKNGKIIKNRIENLNELESIILMYI